jgi:hypothetical protein
VKAQTSPLQANTDLWSAYLSQEWESWLRATRLDSTRVARTTGRLIAAACAPWLTFVTRPEPREDGR